MLNLPFSCEGELVKLGGISFLHVSFGTSLEKETGNWSVMQAKIIHIMGGLASDDCDVRFADTFVCPAGGMFQHLQRLQMNLFLRGGWSENISTKTRAFLTMCGLKIRLRSVSRY